MLFVSPASLPRKVFFHFLRRGKQWGVGVSCCLESGILPSFVFGRTGAFLQKKNSTYMHMLYVVLLVHGMHVQINGFCRSHLFVFLKPLRTALIINYYKLIIVRHLPPFLHMDGRMDGWMGTFHRFAGCRKLGRRVSGVQSWPF